MVEGLFEHSLWVSEAAQKESAMDQIEFLLVDPLIFEIFDLEDAVYRNAGIVRPDLLA